MNHLQYKKIVLILINEYKKLGYESLLCQYNCPLELQTLNNKTQLLPNSACVEACSQKLKQANVSSDIFSANDLKNDNLFSDITNAVNICKTESVNKTSLTMDNRVYFNCVSEKLKSLAVTYPYVK